MHYVSVSKSVGDQVHITIKTENGFSCVFRNRQNNFQITFSQEEKKYKFFLN